jgi:hypothetical protein
MPAEANQTIGTVYRKRSGVSETVLCSSGDYSAERKP